jgi:diguanylate cyclase (GGDEF)-like protein
MTDDEKKAIVPIRVLFVEDNLLDVELALQELRGAGLLVEEKVVSTEPEYRAALEEFKPNVILCDFSFPSFDGETALRIATMVHPLIPLIFVSGTLSEEGLAIAVQHGAVDYIQKSNPVRLPAALLRALERAERQRLLSLAEERVSRLSTIRDVMSAVDRAIVRIHDRGALFQEACRIATDIGKFPFAAIVTCGDEPSGCTVDASAGFPIEEGLERWLASLSPGIQQRGAFVFDDFARQTSARKPRELWDAGIRAIGVFPLTVKGEMIGAMVIAASEEEFFSGEEIGLVTDVASNLSFALDFIREQQRVSRLSRIRDVLAAVNEAIVRLTDVDVLYREVCRIAYEAAGYVSVFAVTVDQDFRHPCVVSATGVWSREVPALELRIAENLKNGRGVVSAAVHTLRAAVVNDLERSDPATLHLHPVAVQDGVRAIGAFPLIVEGRGIGAMVFDSVEAGYFDDEEVALLTNLTSNLSAALNHVHRRERLDRLDRIRDVLSALNVAIVRLRDRSELCREACRIAVEIGGFTKAMVAEIDSTSGEITMPFVSGQSSRSAQDLGVIETSIGSLHPAIKGDFPDSGGIRAAGSFPIIIEERAVGAMVFETGVRDYFAVEEVELLTNLTNNLAFGLNLLEKQQRVDYLSYYDVMTQLPNRALFLDRLGRDLAACKKGGKSLALAIIDISRFSALNNTLGEHVGDEALRKIALRLRETFDESRLARIGGDKFAVTFPMLDDLGPVAGFITEDGIKIFETPVSIQGRDVRVMARAGCAVFPADGAGAEELFQKAEAALVSAKASGATYRFYAPELNERLATQLDLEARLQRAIEENQFVLFYQPKVEVIGRKIVGFEGLLRWNDPERGLIFPSDFIPLLERTGMIIPVGRWALIEAARQYEEWRRAGLNPPRIAMNLSTVQLGQDRLVDDVRSALEGFEESCGLDLEVTESMLFQNIESAIEKLRAIQVLGPRISLDDFGTGYSSLSYIRQLPLNALKIDRSFIIGMLDDVNKRSIVATIISLAGALGLTTIAEGVETEQDARLLELLCCDQMQGYLISKAVPPDLASRFLAT